MDSAASGAPEFLNFAHGAGYGPFQFLPGTLSRVSDGF